MYPLQNLQAVLVWLQRNKRGNEEGNTSVPLLPYNSESKEHFWIPNSTATSFFLLQHDFCWSLTILLASETYMCLLAIAFFPSYLAYIQLFKALLFLGIT